MKSSYQIAASLLILFSAFALWESMKLRYYTGIGPGPGFFPFWVSLALALLASIMLCQATFGRSDPLPDGFFASRGGYLRIAAIIGAWIAAIVLMEPLGFRLTMLAFLAFLLYALGSQKWTVVCAISVGVSFGIFYVFVTWLDVPLPRGFLGF